MKPMLNLLVISGFSLAVWCRPAMAQNFTVAHWINNAGLDAATVLNTNGIFTTSFKAQNDLVVTPVTPLTPGSLTLFTDLFGGATPGNNPGYLTNFVGVATNGTGDKVAGDLTDLEMTYAATGTLQFDFASPLTPDDRILLVDVDGPEQYLVQAYTLNGSTYSPANLTGWKAENFSGTTGIIPNSTWPVWNPAAGTLVSGSSGSLNEELFVLTPAQNISRLVIVKQAGSSWSTDITFVSLYAPLTIWQSGTNAVVGWTNAAFGLQAAPVVTGTYTNIPGAASPYTNAISGSQRFFRLQAN